MPSRVRKVGTTSLTMKLELGEEDAAFKPRERRAPRGYLAEVAAYRIARALGMDNVPPATVVRLRRPVLRARLGLPESRWDPIRKGMLWDDPGVVRGAAIYWIPGLRPTDLDEPEGMARWREWLTPRGAVPDALSDLAADISTMIALDYLIGNWDRFSGGNVSTDAAGQRLYVRDHNLAFQEPLSPDLYDRLVRYLQRVRRFRRRFVEAVHGLSRPSLLAALSAEHEARIRPLLTEEQLGGVMRRRAAFLSYVAALVELHGESEVFYWP